MNVCSGLMQINREIRGIVRYSVNFFFNIKSHSLLVEICSIKMLNVCKVMQGEFY